ncbi:Family description [Thermoplasmatales archaeon SCGC AB-539-N05]|nr:Family description [Thermoplasmatales archaeon SCGC AB-539-N05]
MSGRIILILMIVLSITSTSLVEAINVTKNLDTDNSLQTYSTQFLDIAVADISPYNGVEIMFSGGNGEYTTSQNHKAGGDPEKVISEDFNRDGLDDLAVINYYSGDLCILLQKASGGFDLDEDRQYYTGVGPKNLVSGYFNSDNKVDIAVITMGGEFVNQYGLNVFLGQGNGEFTKQSSAPYNINTIPHDLTTGDFNADGTIDIAVVIETSSIRIYLNKNTGAGDFEYHGSISTSGWRITSGDFNNDGFCDLATTNPGSRTVSVFLGNTSQSDLFEDDTKYPIGGSVPSGLTTGHFDNDGYLDIAVANGHLSQSVSVLLSDSDTGFGPFVTYGVKYKQACNIISGDVNKDGGTDLVVAAYSDTESGGISILFGNSQGSFTRTSLDEYRGSYWGVAIGEFGEFNNQDPSKPEILGPVNGASGTSHDYTFSADDPEDDYIKFEIDWGDGSDIEVTWLCSKQRTESHRWDEDGSYTIQVRTIDHNGGKSEWETLEVTMPKAKSLILLDWIQNLIIRSCPRLLGLLQ